MYINKFHNIQKEKKKVRIYNSVGSQLSAQKFRPATRTSLSCDKTRFSCLTVEKKMSDEPIRVYGKFSDENFTLYPLFSIQMLKLYQGSKSAVLSSLGDIGKHEKFVEIPDWSGKVEGVSEFWAELRKVELENHGRRFCNHI